MIEKFNNNFENFNLVICYDENEVASFISYILKIYKNHSVIKFNCNQNFYTNITTVEKTNKLKYKNHIIFTDEYNIEKISKKQVNKFNTLVFSFFVNKEIKLNLFAGYNFIFSPKTIKHRTQPTVYLGKQYLKFKKWLYLCLDGEYYLNIKLNKLKFKNKITLEYLLDNQEIYNNYEDYFSF